MVDYSKWKDIEISDDEDDTHPNIDTPSLFRWRHQARMERMEERQKEKDKFEEIKKNNKQRIESIKQKIKKAEKDGEEIENLKTLLDQLELEEEKLKKQEKDLEHKEKLTPWNVDTISNPGFTKTVINKPAARNEENLSEEEKEQVMKAFIKDNETLLKRFGMLQKYDDSKQFLMENKHLVCENTANYLVIWCINLCMEGKKNLMNHVAHQCICMQYMMELSKQLDVDPRSCISSFFTKIQVAEKEYKDSFDDELRLFKERIEKRAEEKLAAAIAEQEEEERQARLGPGGLDPLEVMETLPKELQECFEKQDIPLLHEVLSKMDTETATLHMKRCVDSGLWVPDKNSVKETNKEEETVVYEEVKNIKPDIPE